MKKSEFETWLSKNLVASLPMPTKGLPSPQHDSAQSKKRVFFKPLLLTALSFCLVLVVGVGLAVSFCSPDAIDSQESSIWNDPSQEITGVVLEFEEGVYSATWVASSGQATEKQLPQGTVEITPIRKNETDVRLDYDKTGYLGYLSFGGELNGLEFTPTETGRGVVYGWLAVGDDVLNVAIYRNQGTPNEFAIQILPD